MEHSLLYSKDYHQYLERKRNINEQRRRTSVRNAILITLVAILLSSLGPEVAKNCTRVVVNKYNSATRYFEEKSKERALIKKARELESAKVEKERVRQLAIVKEQKNRESFNRIVQKRRRERDQHQQQIQINIHSLKGLIGQLFGMKPTLQWSELLTQEAYRGAKEIVLGGIPTYDLTPLSERVNKKFTFLERLTSSCSVFFYGYTAYGQCAPHPTLEEALIEWKVKDVSEQFKSSTHVGYERYGICSKTALILFLCNKDPPGAAIVFTHEYLNPKYDPSVDYTHQESLGLPEWVENMIENWFGK